MKILKAKWCLGFLALIIFLSSCFKGLYLDQTALQQDNAIKTEALQLVSESSESYSAHAAEVDSLKAHIDAAVQYEKTRGKKSNAPTISMWEAVQNNKGNLYDLLALWKAQNTLSPAAAANAKTQVERLLNSISDLEQHKISK